MRRARRAPRPLPRARSRRRRSRRSDRSSPAADGARAALTLCKPPCSLTPTWRCTSARCSSSSFPFLGRTHRVRGAATSADHESGLPGRPPEREAFFVAGEEHTNAPAEYLAIAFASRDAATATRLRLSVAELVPDARVVRSRTGIVAALRELAGAFDARAHAEALRSRIARANGDDTLSAGVGGPKRGTTGAHLALLQAEQAVILGPPMRGDGGGAMVR